jgi:hypothetical protein
MASSCPSRPVASWFSPSTAGGRQPKVPRVQPRRPFILVGSVNVRSHKRCRAVKQYSRHDIKPNRESPGILDEGVCFAFFFRGRFHAAQKIHLLHKR